MSLQNRAIIAQLVVQVFCKDKVGGSNPSDGIEELMCGIISKDKIDGA